jgi:hypothetical protein
MNTQKINAKYTIASLKIPDLSQKPPFGSKLAISTIINNSIRLYGQKRTIKAH